MSGADDIPLFHEGSAGPQVWSAAVMNRLVRRLNALARGKINIQQAEVNADGSFSSSGKWNLSDNNLIIDLLLNNQAGGSGSGSSVQLFQVTTAYTLGDQFVTCGTATATGSNTYTNLGDGIKIALPYKLRTNTYSSPALFPTYAVNDIIIATQPTGGTGVYSGGADVGWQDVNFDARRWQDDDYFTFGTMFATYFTATSIVSGLTVSIARPKEFLNSTPALIGSETIDGNTFTYTYGASSPYTYVARLAACSALSIQEYQVIVPRYIATSIIHAKLVNTGMTDGSSDPICWQEVSGREWAMSSVQSGYE